MNRARLLRRSRVLAVLLGLAILSSLLGCARLLLYKGVPRTEGTIAGLPVREPVEIIRDRYGIPHIYAKNERDLMVALGWVHA
jgi:penicillin G amidase